MANSSMLFNSTAFQTSVSVYSRRTNLHHSRSTANGPIRPVHPSPRNPNRSRRTFITNIATAPSDRSVRLRSTSTSQSITSNGSNVAITPGKVNSLNSTSELRRAVVDASVVVLKLYTRSCRACMGVAPRFKKLANAYAGKAQFVEMECGKQSDILQELGVNQLPFFAVWRDGNLVSAEAIGFSRIKRLSENVADAVR